MSFLKKSLGIIAMFFTGIMVTGVIAAGQAGKIVPEETPQDKVTVTDNSAAYQEGLVLGDETKAEEKVVEDKPVDQVRTETPPPAQEENKQVTPAAPNTPAPVEKVVAPTPPAPAPAKVTAPVVPKPAPPAPAPITKSSAKYYTSSHSSAKLYYPENCDGWKELSKSYLRSFDSLEALLIEYPNKKLSPQCN